MAYGAVLDRSVAVLVRAASRVLMGQPAPRIVAARVAVAGPSAVGVAARPAAAVGVAARPVAVGVAARPVAVGVAARPVARVLAPPVVVAVAFGSGRAPDANCQQGPEANKQSR